METALARGKFRYHRAMDRWGLSLVGLGERVSEVPWRDWPAVRDVRVGVPLDAPDDAAAQVEAALASGLSVLAVAQGPLWRPFNEWTGALEGLAARFKDRVRHWEIGSEPDDPRSGWPQDDLQTYAAALVQAARRLRVVDPAMRIHNAGLGRSLPKGLARLHALGAAGSIDIWNVHPYMSPLMPDAKGGLAYFQRLISQTLERLGESHKPVWWSSFACPGLKDPRSVPDWWLGKNPAEPVQAEWARTALAVAHEGGVARVFWEGALDRPGLTCTGIDAFGWRRADGSDKPIARQGKAAPVTA